MSTTPTPARATRRIGHKGADLISPGNTLASFEAGLAAGVDMIEFDVLSEQRDGTGELYLVHDYKELAHRAAAGENVTLEEGLAHFATEAYAGIELDVDLKIPGYEERVVEALRRHGLLERTLISTMETSSLQIIRGLEPSVRLGWSVPKVRRNYLAHPATKPLALVLILFARFVLPRRLARAVRAGEVDAIMSHESLVTAGFWKAIREAGGELYVWTVDDAQRIAELERLGVTGVITNDPRLFVD